MIPPSHHTDDLDHIADRAILHDENAYPNPSKFDPDRFMLNGKLNPTVRDPKSTAAFGFGRRICPGRFMAEDSMWIVMATILATLDVKPVIGEDGKPIIPVGEYEEGLVAYVLLLVPREI